MVTSQPKHRYRTLLRLVLLVVVVLLVPLATTFLWGEFGSDWLEEARADGASTNWLIAVLVATLAADILLPVPSGPLITLVASQLGWVTTSIWAWVGLTLGGGVAFVVAKWGARRLVDRFAKHDDVEQLAATADDNLFWLILLTRPLPMIAEVVVLVAGLLGCRLDRFLISLCIGNALVAGTFALLGETAANNDMLSMAVASSIAGPIALSFFARRWWQSQHSKAETVGREPDGQ